ncbi:DUF4199 domain-containing protein [Ancylomarina longa]|uniref:DUF4199 domain-containing protein n=1 Tax=Ancylomarina longa TaxID=2487017 RepID=A0A434ATP8_9BACT|nr:DUF4199 domain-containing protein [Ancylomarina longa]RUT77799.1 DUF4199 domain-containing protein [Ancylomarina longa]
MFKNPLVRHTFLFGSLVGGVLILAALVFYFKDLSVNYNPNLTLINQFLMISGIFLGVKKYRDEILFGVINYKRAFTAGILIIGFAACYYAMFIYVLTKFFDASIIQEAINFAQKGLVQSGYEQKDVDLIMSIYKHITPGIFAFSMWLSKLFGGVLFSLVVAFFFRQKRNLFNKQSVDKFNESNNQ